MNAMNNVTRILIVEDLPADFDLACREIRRTVQNPEFKRVQSERDFLQALHDFQPDLILADYRLPSFDGMRAVELTHQHTDLVPIIIWTGTMSEDVAVACMKKGAANYIFKENMKRLGPAVTHALEERKLLLESKDAQEKLTRNERVLRLFVEHSPAAIAMLDREMRYIVASRRFLVDYHLGEEQDLMGRSHYDVFPEIPERWRKVHQRCLAGAIEKSNEDVFPRLNGQVDWIRWEIRPWYDAAGEAGGIIIFSEVITERRRAESERRALFEIMQGLTNTNDLQAFLKLIHDAIARVIPAENFFVVLYQPEDRLFREIYTVDKYDPPAPPSRMEKSITSYVFRSGEPLLLTKDRFNELVAQGEIELVGTSSESWLGIPLKTSNGTIGVLAVQDYESADRYSERDKDFLASIASQVALAIERKQAEDLLRESEERFSSAFEYAPIGKALVALDGAWLRVNRALCEMVGYSQEELLHRTFQDITHPEDLPMDVGILEQLQAGNVDSCQFEKRYFHKMGHVIQALLSVSVVRDSEGKPLYLITQMQDVTQRRQAEESEREQRALAEALRDTAETLGSTLDYGEVLDRILNAAARVVPHDAATIMLIDGECAYVARSQGYDRRNIQNQVMDIRLSLAETNNLRQMLETGETLIVNDTHSYAGWKSFPFTRWLCANVGAPISIYGTVIGFILLDSASAGFFTPVHAERLKAFASQAAIAIHNARLLQQAQDEITERKRAENDIRHHLAELQALYENGLAVGQLLEPREIGNRIIRTFTQHLSWHHVAIRLLRPGSDAMELVAFSQPGIISEAEQSELESRLNRLVNKVGQGLSGWVVQTGEPFRTGDVRSNSQYVDTHSDIKSGLYMPLKIGERIIGAISVESEQANAFTAQDERLLATLANQAAIAFENARLYNEAQQELMERKRAQEALWASETHYRELADSITDILFEMDHDRRYTHWNKASEMLTGIPAEHAIGRSMDEIFGTSEQQMQIARIYEEVVASRQARTFTTDLTVQGQQRTFEINAYPSTRGVAVVAKDVTERRLSETLMQKRFELMEYSAHHSLDEVMQKTINELCDLTDSRVGFLHFVEADEVTLRLQTWSEETLRSFCTAEGQGMHYPVEQAGVWADAVRQRRPIIHNDYVSLVGKKGMPKGHPELVRELVIPIIRNDRIVAVTGVGNKAQDYTEQDVEIARRFADYAWDTTERKQMESALAEERNQLAKRVEERTSDLSRANANLARALLVKDEFLANMSHELRTPLNAILGLSESLAEQAAGPLNAKQQRYLTTINESGHHLLSLINDILDLAKVEAGQIALDISKVDVNSVCQASLRMIKQLAQKKNQEVIFRMDKHLGLIRADERRLKQMIVNLLSNAVKFTPETGRIGLEVRTDAAANKVIFTVWDNGIGIQASDMDRLFKPFVQLDSGLAREATGTGLGLALVVQMARLHGGGVSVTSAPGAGSRFNIELPWEPVLPADAVAHRKNPGTDSASDLLEGSRPTILLIEDTREVVMTLTDYLEVAGFKIVTAQDGVDGLIQAQLMHPELILMDIQMPRMDGIETTQKMRSDPKFKTTPIIALTALAMPDDRQRCLDAGMDDYMSKPVNLRELVKAIRRLILQAREADHR